jgi:hypothetical protein
MSIHYLGHLTLPVCFKYQINSICEIFTVLEGFTLAKDAVRIMSRQDNGNQISLLEAT